MMLQPTDPPGRAGPGPAKEAPPPATTAAPATSPSGATDAKSAVGSSSTGGFGGMAMFIPFVILFGFIFLMSRSEKKKRKQLEEKLKKGDRVVTRSGITGKLTEVGESRVRLEIAPGVNVSMVKTAIEGLDGGDTPAGAADAKGADKSNDKSNDKNDKGSAKKKKR